MAKLSAHGKSLVKYFDPKAGKLVSVHEDGVTLMKSPLSGGWKLAFKKKADMPFEAWKAAKLAKVAALPDWAKEVKSLPSLATLKSWNDEGGSETVTGDWVEPDGHGPDGAPSWLLALKMI